MCWWFWQVVAAILPGHENSLASAEVKTIAKYEEKESKHNMKHSHAFPSHPETLLWVVFSCIYLDGFYYNNFTDLWADRFSPIYLFGKIIQMIVKQQGLKAIWFCLSGQEEEIKPLVYKMFEFINLTLRAKYDRFL